MNTDPTSDLHPALVHHIVNSLGWPRLRPLQRDAVAPLLAGNHAILVAPTAGGKTEAAIFPFFSRMLSEDWTGLTVLYLCPLRALLNNLHIRLESYARLLGRTVGLWHGDVGDAARQRLLREPPDILLTTPESLESMLVSTRVAHDEWFGNLRAVVIDEAHAFGGDDRGWHLLAVLERVSRLAGQELQRVALSATVGNPRELLDWMTSTCDGPKSIVQPEVGSPAVVPEIGLDYVGNLDNAAVVISRLHRGEKRLVFVDSRSKAELLTAGLRAHGVPTFLSHGSLGREERRRSEDAFSNEREAVIVATSTLELGIDVGDLDRVIQIDAPTTVASFLQRLGRTGRRSDTSRNTLFLATSDDALLRAAALLVRWSRGQVEPVQAPALPVHLMAQQLLAITLQEGGVGRRTWTEWLGEPFVFGSDVAELATVVTDHLVDAGYLVDDGGLVGVGPRAETDLGRRHFLELLAVFTAPPMFTVLHGRHDVGVVPDQVLQLGSDGRRRALLLAGRSWNVNHVDWQRRVVHVEPVDARGIARWQGGGAPLSAGMARTVRSVLSGTDPSDVELSRRATTRLAELRAEHSWVRDDTTTIVRDEQGRLRWWTFAGDLAGSWLASGLTQHRRTVSTIDSFSLGLDPEADIAEVRRSIAAIDPDQLSLAGGIADDAVDGLKFGELLPADVARRIVATRLDDRSAARAVLEEPVHTAE